MITVYFTSPKIVLHVQTYFLCVVVPGEQFSNKQKQSIDRKTLYAYKQAFKKGKKTANKFKIVMLGAEGAGKTSTVHSLLNKTFQHDQLSTIGADVNTCTAERFFTTKWKQIEVQRKLKNLPKQFKSNLKTFMLEKSLIQTSEKPVVSIKSEKEVPQEYFEEEEIPHHPT